MRIDYGHEEYRHLNQNRDPRIYSISTKKFMGGTDGRVCGLCTVQVEWMKDEATGRMNIKVCFVYLFLH